MGSKASADAHDARRRPVDAHDARCSGAHDARRPGDAHDARCSGALAAYGVAKLRLSLMTGIAAAHDVRGSGVVVKLRLMLIMPAALVLLVELGRAMSQLDSRCSGAAGPARLRLMLMMLAAQVLQR